MWENNHRFPQHMASDAERVNRDAIDLQRQVDGINELSPYLASQQYLLPFGIIGQFTTVTPGTADYVYAWPFTIALDAQLDLVRYRLVTAQTGALAKVGLYTDSFGNPNALLEDLGETDLSTGSGTDIDSVATATVVGRFWVALYLKGVSPQVSVVGPNGYSAAAIRTVVPADVLVNGLVGCLAAAESYPAGALPDPAPAMSPFTSLSVPVPIVRAA